MSSGCGSVVTNGRAGIDANSGPKRASTAVRCATHAGREKGGGGVRGALGTDGSALTSFFTVRLAFLRGGGRTAASTSTDGTAMADTVVTDADGVTKSAEERERVTRAGRKGLGGIGWSGE